jgi:hypothetical protein
MKRDMFFCIGAQKSGTTTLHNILSQNPNICLPKEKETQFFSKTEINQKGLEYYFKHYFEQRLLKKAKILGEIDPSYSFFPGALKRIKNQLSANYKLKFIFVLRNPLNRAFSHYLMSVRRGYEKMEFEDAIEIEEERIKDSFGNDHFSYIKRGNYLGQIDDFLKGFSEDQILYLVFEEDLKSNPQIAINKIHQFLGLLPFKYNINLKSNYSSEPKSKLVRNFIYEGSILKDFLKKILPFSKILKRIKYTVEQLNLRPIQNQIPSKKLAEKTWKTFFEKDISRLETKIGRSLNSWKI